MSATPQPSGLVTFVLTDVVGSTRLWERNHDAMASAMARHDRIVADIIAGHGGYQPTAQGEGDSVVAAFKQPSDGAHCAAAIQQALDAEAWPDGISLRVRIAVHTGEASLRDGTYFGVALSRCARLRALAHGGQTLLTLATSTLVRGRLRDDLELRDHGLHLLRDLSQPEHVFELSEVGAADHPPLRSTGASASNLPAQLTSFVGRTRELAELSDLVPNARLVTLTGSGGCGKTRLALQVAGELMDSFDDGTWFVELAPIRDGSLVVDELARALGVQADAGRPVIDQLEEHLRPRHTLLVLDNCEHLLDEASAIVDRLLRASPRLHLLATGREALGIAGETAWRVPSLDAPEDTDLSVLAGGWEDYEAIRLFVDRARLLDPAIPRHDREVSAIARICRRLDGIPLAIELAAARARVMSPEQIDERMGDRFRLLTGGSRTALPRQQTLRAAVDWSHALLDDDERVLFRRLAVFVGGCTLESVEAVTADVASGVSLRSDDVVDLVERLVDKSLVEAVRTAAGVRYRTLETIRQYGLERLLDSGEADLLRSRHLAWFLELARRAEAALSPGGGTEAAHWLDTLEREHDNLRAALAWAVDAPTELSTGALELALALYPFWWMRGHVVEASDWYDRLLPAARDADPATRARALRSGSVFALFLGAGERARELAEEALALARAAGDLDVLSSTVRLLATERDLDRGGLELLESTAAELRVAGAERLLVWHLRSLALAVGLHGDTDRARSLIDEARALASDADVVTRGWIHETAALVAVLRHDLAAANHHLDTGLQGADVRAVSWATAALRAAAAVVAAQEGRLDSAEDIGRQAVVELRRVGDEPRVALASAHLAHTCARANRSDEAIALLSDLEPRAHALGWRRVQVVVALVRGEIALSGGRRSEAVAAFTQADDLLAQLGHEALRDGPRDGLRRAGHSIEA